MADFPSDPHVNKSRENNIIFKKKNYFKKTE